MFLVQVPKHLFDYYKKTFKLQITDSVSYISHWEIAMSVTIVIHFVDDNEGIISDNLYDYDKKHSALAFLS